MRKNSGYRHLQHLAVRQLCNGMDVLQFTAGQAVSCNRKSCKGMLH